jgi:hypothetical protein
MPAPVTREQVMSALLTALGAAAGFATVSRHIEVIEGGPGTTPTVATPPAQPGLYLFEDHEETIYNAEGSPPSRTWFVELWLWCKSPVGATLGVPDMTTPGVSVINPLIEAIEAAFKPDDFRTNRYTIGGLVQYARIQGTTVKISGDANPDGQNFAAIPVRILVP